MKKLSYMLLSLAATTAGCHSAPADEAKTAISPVPMAPTTAATALVAEAPAGPPYLGYHRYRGTVGSQPVTVELTASFDATGAGKTVCEGLYNYDRHPVGYLSLHAPLPYQPRQPLVLTETDATHADQPTGRWQATRALGAILTGMWSSPAGKQLPFSLREDYTDGRGHLMAVRYEIVGEEAQAPCRPAREEYETKAAYRARIATFDHSNSQQFLHLLGPDTLRPSLQALQCPVPAERRQQVRAAAREDDGCSSHTASLAVDYNNYGLLAWSEAWTDEFIGGARPGHGQSATVYDLRTGHVLTMAGVFRADTDTLLQRLITQHILHDDNPDLMPISGLAVPVRADDLAPLPSDFSLEEDGMAFLYNIDQLAHLTEGGAIILSVPVPYRELLPLLRPDSPVARMLRERGLWRGK